MGSPLDRDCSESQVKFDTYRSRLLLCLLLLRRLRRLLGLLPRWSGGRLDCGFGVFDSARLAAVALGGQVFLARFEVDLGVAQLLLRDQFRVGILIRTVERRDKFFLVIFVTGGEFEVHPLTRVLALGL